MSALALWTWLAVWALLAIPPVVFVLFLRDAVRMLRQFDQPGAVDETSARAQHDKRPTA